MAKIRDPARDEAKKIYLNNKGITNREIANRLNVDEKKIATWKYRDNWDDATSKKKSVVQQNGKCSTTNKKKLLQQAKAIVINGGTIKEASEQTGVKKSTLENYSAKEKWIDQQEKFMQKVYGELQREFGELHIQDKRNAIKYIHNSISEVLIKDNQKALDIKEIALKKEIMDYILKSIKGQSEIIGIAEMKMYIRQDKEDKIDTTKDRTINIKVVK